MDVAALKSEFLYQYQEENGYSFRSKSFATSTKFNRIASKVPGLYNAFARNPITGSLIKSVIGIHQKRTIPRATKSYTAISKGKRTTEKNTEKTVYLFVDEFTNYLESELAVDAVYLLESLNYNVIPIDYLESGRTYISKGFLKEAKEIINENVAFCKDMISSGTPLIGLEPSAILTFRDENLRLADDKESAKSIASNTFTIEEFLSQEYSKGNIKSSQFTNRERELKIHGHCHQKALSSTHSSFQILNIPKNYKPTIMNTGCCGMAGSFGYEKEHYKVSMQVGEDTLFPKVRNTPKETIIAAAGTSCRHQIYDGTKRIAKHPVSILKEALI